jgi:hypothetical protein
MTNLERFSSQGKLKTLKILKCILVSIYFLVAKYFLCIFLEVHAEFGILPQEHGAQLHVELRFPNSVKGLSHWDTLIEAFLYNRTFFARTSVLLPLLTKGSYRARILVVGREQPYIIQVYLILHLLGTK